jgi:hypothetical protein
MHGERDRPGDQCFSGESFGGVGENGDGLDQRTRLVAVLRRDRSVGIPTSCAR